MLVRIAVGSAALLLVTACSVLEPIGSGDVTSVPTRATHVDASPTTEDSKKQCESLKAATPVDGVQNAEVLAAFVTTEAGFARVHEVILASSGIDNIGGVPDAEPTDPSFAEQPVLICYFEGSFQLPGPTRNGTEATRLLVRLGNDGVVEPIAIGPDESVPIVDPSAIADPA